MIVLNKKGFYLILVAIISFLILTNFFQPVVAQESNVVVEYYYETDCETCLEETTPIIDEIEEYYGDIITLMRYPTDIDLYRENYQKMKSYELYSPSVVIINTSAQKYDSLSEKKEDFTKKNIISLVDYHLEGNYSVEKPKLERDNILDTPFGKLNLSELSLPVLTIVLGALDSINPCSFFIFLILLSLLIHMHSRKKMLLVAGIFIFFSGFFYFLLMVAMINVFSLVENQIIITLIAGCLALIFGGLNIKDFFFFKRGFTTSIPEDKKNKLYKQMRNIAKITYMPGLIGYTIILAISVNTVELFCTLGLPLVYTNILYSYHFSSLTNYCYIALYNIVYVIPLVIMVLIFAIILKHWKMSEWQGRILKLYAGMLMVALGLILIIYPGFLHNIFGAIVLIGISLLGAFLVSFIWKKFIDDKASK